MAVHEINFMNVLRLQNNSMMIRWADSKTKANDKMVFRIALGRLGKAIEEEAQKKPLPMSPYADKNGRVKTLAEQIKSANREFDRQLFALISTCTPIQYQDNNMAEAAIGYQFVFDEMLAQDEPLRLMTPGELLSLTPVKDRGMDLIPVKKTSYLYALCAAVLREWGFQAYFSYINEYAFRRDIKTSIAAVSVIVSNGEQDDLWIIAPALMTLRDKLVCGVRIMDDVSFFSYLNLMAADEAGRMFDNIITPKMVEMLGRLGCSEIAKDIMMGVPFSTSIGGNTAIKMQGLLDQNIGGSILGKDTYNKLLSVTGEWIEKGGEEVKKMADLMVNIENGLSNSFEYDSNLPMTKEVLRSILISLTPFHQCYLIEHMKQRGYDLLQFI